MLLAAEPSQEKLAGLSSYTYPPGEKYSIVGKDAYLFSPKGWKLKMSNTFLESKLDVHCTTRNWRTIVKVCKLALE